MLFRGVNDFYKGVDFLKTTDGEALHKEIMGAGYKGVPMEELADTAYRIGDYDYSMVETEGRLKKMWRYVTINGFLLPARKSKGTKVKVVSMAQCRPINFYRQKKVLNYDPSSGKGFVTEKSWGKAVGAVFKLAGMTVKSVFVFNKAKNKFRAEAKQITNEQFWGKYLNL